MVLMELPTVKRAVLVFQGVLAVTAGRVERELRVLELQVELEVLVCLQ
jgi:hypothetical protein